MTKLSWKSLLNPNNMDIYHKTMFMIMLIKNERF